MRAVIERQQVEPALRWHTTGSSVRPLRIAVTEDGTLTIESASSDMWRRSVLPLNTDCVPGEARLVPARLLDQMKAAAKTDTLTIEGHPGSNGVGEGVVTTRLGRSAATNPLLAEVPGFWEPPGPIADLAEVDAEDFLWAMRAAAGATATASSGGAEAQKGMHVRVDGSMIVLSGTNSYRLVQTRVECMGHDEVNEHLVPPGAFVTAAGIMGDPMLLIASGDRHLGLTDGTHTMLAGTMGDQFNDISAVMKQSAKTDCGAVVDAKELASALAGVGAGHHGQVEMTFTNQVMQVANRVTEDGDIGRTEVHLSATVDGLAEKTLTVNTDYLAGLLKSIRTGQVELSINSTQSRSPLVLREVGTKTDSGSQYLGALALVRR